MILHEKQCIPFKKGTLPLLRHQWDEFLPQLNDGWKVIPGHMKGKKVAWKNPSWNDGDHLERTWEFKDFQSALDFVNAAGAVCEEQSHHAEFDFGWGRAKVMIWTHVIGGLTESDFVLASKLDQL